MQIDLKHVKPYGDTLNDGAMQLSFTLPTPADENSKQAALLLAEKMGLAEASVVHQGDLKNGFSFYVVYGKCTHDVDLTAIHVPKVDTKHYSFEQVNKLIQENLGREIVVVGACTGSDAHTVGIDAIMNMKGYNFHYGLERYPSFDALNLGSQVPNEQLIRKAIDMKADAILVSQVVTQKDAHIQNLTEFIELAESFGIREQMIMIVGGPRISHQLAIELGFDAGFGPGTYADHVASYIYEFLQSRN